jgi:hypothetical protein
LELEEGEDGTAERDEEAEESEESWVSCKEGGLVADSESMGEKEHWV